MDTKRIFSGSAHGRVPNRTPVAHSLWSALAGSPAARAPAAGIRTAFRHGHHAIELRLARPHLQGRHEGRIRAGGVDKGVAFVEEADPGINEQIDAAYRTKYRRYAASFVDTTVTPEARAATLKLVPRQTNA